MTSRVRERSRNLQHRGIKVEGRLGAIYIGKSQVGGFLDWHVKMNLTSGTNGDDATHKLQSWRVVAWAHWLFRLLEPDTVVRLKLCSSVGNAYWEGVGKVSCQPTRTIGALIHVQIEFTGSGELEGNGVPDEK